MSAAVEQQTPPALIVDQCDTSGTVGNVYANQNPFTENFFTLQQLYQQPEPDNWLLKGLLCRGELFMLFGDSGSGKSFVALDLLMSLATGEDWCNGLFAVDRPHTCIYAYGEGRRGVPKRFYALECRYREQGGILQPSIYAQRFAPQLFDRESAYSVHHFIEAYQKGGYPAVDVVIIDTLSRSSIGADENATKDMNNIIAGADLLQHQLGASVGIIHHTNKAGTYRGNTALRAAMDVIIEARKLSENRFVLRCDKAKDVDPFTDQAFSFMSYEESSVIIWAGASTYSEVTYLQRIQLFLQEHAGEWYSAKQISDALGIQHSHTCRELKRLAHLPEYGQQPREINKPPSSHNPIVYRAIGGGVN